MVGLSKKPYLLQKKQETKGKKSRLRNKRRRKGDCENEGCR